MYPHERSLVIEMKDKPFALIGVNSDTSLEKIRKIVKQKNITWRSFQNQPQGAPKSISDDWAITGWPTLVIIDTAMQIAYRGHDGEEATAVAKQLIADLGAK